jgi:hypothetical protein
VRRSHPRALVRRRLVGVGVREAAYGLRDDLPKLYGLVAGGLKLAPDQHRDVPIKAILGGP